MSAVDYNFCPRCGAAMSTRAVAGKTLPACPACNFIAYLDPKVVVLAVIEHQGRVLLGRRNIDPQRGKWSWSGGYVDRGEALEDALRREVREETNLEISVDGLLNVYSGGGNPHVLIVYRATVPDGVAAMRLQPEELTDLLFFSPTDLPELAFPGDYLIIRDWLAWRTTHESI